MIQRIVQAFYSLKETLFGVQTANVLIQSPAATKCKNSCSRNRKQKKTTRKKNQPKNNK